MMEHLQKFKKLVVIILIVTCLVSVQVLAYAQKPYLKLEPCDSPDVYKVLMNDEVIMRLGSVPQGLSAYERANVILNRIKTFASQGTLSTDNIKVQSVNGVPTLTVGEEILVTVTYSDLQEYNLTTWDLLEVWKNRLEYALTKPQEPVREETPPEVDQQDYTSVLTEDEHKMFDLVNQERIEAGLSPLNVNPELVVLARMKSQDMIDNEYFAHESPTYGTVYNMLKAAEIAYTRAGENLAGSAVVERAHNNLMNSPGHRSNILNKYYTCIGIGIIEGGPFGKMFTQMFIKKYY